MGKTLYKYRSINCYTYDLLNNSELFFSFPHDFNDPYDCFIKSEYFGNEEDWNKFLDRIITDSKKKHDIIEMVRDLDFDKDKIKDRLPEEIGNNINNFLILHCFTENPGNIVMWSHYAKNHEGICLGFKTELVKPKEDPDKELYKIMMNETIIKNSDDDKRSYALIYKVKYLENFPEPYNGLKEFPSALMRFLITKSKSWEYEEEYRGIVIYGDVNKQNLEFKKEILSEVILGINISTENETKILTLIQNEYINKGINVKLKRAIRNQFNYEINFEDIN